LLQDETCFFLAVDFDKASWRDDAAAFRETCRDLVATHSVAIYVALTFAISWDGTLESWAR